MIRVKKTSQGLTRLLAFNLFLLGPSAFANELASASITLIDQEYNSSSWAAANLLDGNSNTRWLSRNQTNDLNFLFDNGGEPLCIDSFDLTNYGNDDRSVREFMLLTTTDGALSADAGTEGWRPVVAEENPSGDLNYLSWAQGARLTNIDSEYNSTSWGADNCHDGSTKSRWLSRKANNNLEFQFDTDWNGVMGNEIVIDKIGLMNYGVDDRSVKYLQVEYTKDGVNWAKLEVPGSDIGDVDFNYALYQNDGQLDVIDGQYNSSTWAAKNLQDGDDSTRWLDRGGNNVMEFSFDPDDNGITGLAGDTDDAFTLQQISLRNYGNDDRSVHEFQVAVKTLSNTEWQKISVPGSVIGQADYNFALSHHGAQMTSIDGQYNTSSWAAANLHDGDLITRWLSRKGNNVLTMQFDVNEDGTAATVDDYFSFDRIYLKNYGNDDRSIRQFQVQVKTASNTNWHKIPAPGSMIGESDYNFALSFHGANLQSIDGQYNNTSWAAANIHDGDPNTRWLNRKANNILAFQFDVDEDGNSATVDDYFSFNKIYLQNYGNDDRSIRQFQVEVKTASNTQWHKISVPGSDSGESDFNFALSHHGGVLDNINSQYNSTSWAAANIHDGDSNTRWLSYYGNNTLDFKFDPNEDGTTGSALDVFTLASFYLANYGTDDRSVRQFQIEVKTTANTTWQKIPVKDSVAGTAGYNFALSAHGGHLTSIDAEYNSTSWAAANLHDGDRNTRWLASKQNNSLVFAFDTDFNGIAGDEINLDTIELYNYGNDDRSVATFEIDVQISGGAWQTIDSPDGGTTFNANMNSSGQSWSITPLANVSAVRFRSLTNHGDPSYTGARELILSGDSVGRVYTYTAAMNGSGETFDIDIADQPVGVTDVRFRTINNYGDPSYTGARELRLFGESVTEGKTFVAEMHGNGQTFTLDPEDVPVDVTDVRLITISNYGDPSYTGAREFQLLGDSVTRSNTFTAAMTSAGETFTLDAGDVPEDVTDFRLITINNHGDPSYTGASELKLLGNSITRTKTFTAEMSSNYQYFNIPIAEQPVDVTAVRLSTISNHGDPSYTGIAEFGIIGPSVTPHTIFEFDMHSDLQIIELDVEDTVEDVTGLRIVTIENHGDPSYTGVREFQILGNATTPSYVFTAEQATGVQNFNFSSASANVLRFHSLNNHGDPSYTGAAEFAVGTGTCLAPQWRMDVGGWNGTLNEVLDSSGNGYDGQAFGFNDGDGPNTATTNPAINADPGTCSYGTFDGNDDYIEVIDGKHLDNLSQVTISAWVNARSFGQNNGGSNRGVFAKGPSSAGQVSYGAFFDGSDSKLKIDIDGNGDRYSSSTNFVLDTWYHIAIVFDGTQDSNTRGKLYVNGDLDGSFSETATVIANDDGNFYIGNFFNNAGAINVFDGFIDEVNVRPYAMSEGEIEFLMNNTRDCTVPLHHIEISHDGGGLTCAAETLTLKACADENCTAVSPTDVVVTLSSSGSASSWSVNPVTIPGNSTSGVNVTLRNTTAESLTVSATSVPATSNGVTCLDGSGNSCDITFSEAGFVLSLADHKSCSAATLTIQALESAGPASCAPTYTGSQNVDFLFNYNTPNTGTRLPSIDGQAVSTVNVAETRTVTFDNTGTATVDFVYNDAGSVYLQVADSSGSSGISAGTTTAVAYPDAISLDVVGNAACNSNFANCAAFAQAGNEFTVNATAVCEDGSTVTPNFTLDDIGLSVTTIAPTISPENAVTLGTEQFDFAINGDGSGIQSFQQSIDEVGVFTLTATPPNNGYFGHSIGPGSSENIGRITPHHYALVTSSVDHAFGNTTYMGQDALAFSYQVQAQNAANQVTANYVDDFVKATIAVSAVNNDDGIDLGDRLTDFAAATWAAGVVDYSSTGSFSRDDAELGPYDLMLFSLVVADSDGVLLNGTDILADADLTDCITTDKTNTSFLTTECSQIRFARLNLLNAFGSELEALPIPLQIEYWNGTKFVLNEGDNNTSFTSTGAVLTYGTLTSGSTELSGSGTVVQGSSRALLLDAPTDPNDGASVAGDLTVELQVPDWLQYDWQNSDGNLDGPYDDNPTNSAVFGRFRGNDRIIYKRER